MEAELEGVHGTVGSDEMQTQVGSTGLNDSRMIPTLGANRNRT
jgi:hypothetical protein